MATKESVLRLLLQQRPDTGEDAVVDLDTSLTLAGYKVTSRQEITLGAAETKNVALTSSTMVVLASVNDETFKLRLRSGELQMTNLKQIALGGDAEDLEVVPAGSIVLEGNGTNEAQLLVITVEKTA